MTTHRKIDRSCRAANGLILLVVLGMLALFALLAITFVILSSQSRSASKTIAAVKLRRPDSRGVLELTTRQLLRGTRDSSSAFFGHDLLGDVYGDSPILGHCRNPTELFTSGDGVEVFGNTFLKVPLDPWDVTHSNPLLANVDGAYNGRLFTFLAGPLEGHSFRIMNYIGDRRSNLAPDYSLRYSVLLNLAEFSGVSLDAKRLQGAESGSLQQWIARSPNTLAYDVFDYSRPPSTGGPTPNFYQPYRFLINDSAFSGVGRGLELDPASRETGNLSQTLTASGTLQLSAGLLHQSPTPDSWRQGGTNEGFDVADYRDFFLSYRPLHGSGPNGTVVSRDLIPSFHRPELVNYIANLFGNPASMPRSDVQPLIEWLDLACARPMSVRLLQGGSMVYQRNPNFTGSNNPVLYRNSLELNLDLWPGSEANKLQEYVAWLINGEWDVDSDRDGVADSVWVDPNLPLITSPDGKIIKALIAPMVEDLDGKININTAGDASHADPGFRLLTDDAFVAGPLTHVTQGFGYGPADISFDHLLNLSNYPVGETPFDLRNGIDRVPGIGGVGSDDVISRFYQREQRSRHRHSPNTVESSSGLPVSSRGGLGWGIDRFGNPIVLPNTVSGQVPSETENDPYESRQRNPSAQDELFSIAELEAVLRRYDSSQALLPDRLKRTLELGAGVNGPASIIHQLFTTRSAELRHPTIAVPNGLAAGNMLGWIQMLHEERYRRTNGPLEPFQIDLHDPQIQVNIIRQLFPIEFRQGLRFNINRPFGDGRDTDGDGQVDEPEELGQGNEEELYPGAPSTTGDYAQGFVGQPARLASRQMMARQLYCLAYLIVPRDYRFPGTASLTPEQASMRRARILAQWAINVVDFRDADAAMSRFAYDAFPFGAPGRPPKDAGWDPQPGNVVWGLEFPELALTESLAFHDKRTKDTDQDDGSGTTLSRTDTSRDQYRIPQGSLFLELGCLRTTGDANQQQLPSVQSSLYTEHQGLMKLDLGRLSPSNPQWGSQPVWRIGISNVHDVGFSPNEWIHAESAAPTEVAGLTFQTCRAGLEGASGLYFDLTGVRRNFDFDRIVWFTSQDPGAVPQIPNLTNESDPHRRHRVFQNRNVALPYLEGGAYAVLGPRELTYLGTRVSTASPPIHLPSPQRIALRPSDVATYRLDGQIELGRGAGRKPALGIVVAAEPPDPSWDGLVNQPTVGLYGVGINVSEPLSLPGSYYPRPTSQLNSGDIGSSSGFLYPGFQGLPADAYKNFGNASGKTLPDLPFDQVKAINPVLSSDSRVAHEVGTHPNFRTAYLQRLADPELPYHPSENPYITLDWISIDLTVFNGEDSEPAQDPIKFAFQSRYKDGADGLHLTGNAGIDPQPPLVRRTTVGTNVLTYSTSTLVETGVHNGARQTLPGGSIPYFDIPLGISSPTQANSAASLGGLNAGRPLLPGSVNPVNFDGYGPSYNSAINLFDGSSSNPLGSYFCINRPFASPYELMLVSPASPGELNRVMTYAQLPSLFMQASSKPFGPFGQLINFFDASSQKSDNRLNDGSVPFTPYWMKRGFNSVSKQDDPPNQADLQMLLELVETPQAYSDSGVVIPPNAIESVPPVVRNAMLSDFLPPRNMLPSYVNSGKVNLNTIAGEEVWKGIDYNFLRGSDRTAPRGNTIWPRIAESRRGYNTLGVSSIGLPDPSPSSFLNASHQNPNLHSQFPTQFAGAFRSSFLGNIAPSISNPPLGTKGLRQELGVGSGLLRPDLSTSATLPLMLTGTPGWLGPYPQSDRQPYIALQRIVRLPNLVSFQSNLFAVHMTVGFFEYDPSNGLGHEYVGFSGEPIRQRAFVIIDRSIPTAYRPGEDLNTRGTILLERYLE